MSCVFETVTYKGHAIELIQDKDAENPRTSFDNVGEILYTSSRYTLGDRRVDSNTIREITERDDVIFLPVYAYIHGCTRLSTGSWRGRAQHAGWDSGQCGIIWCPKDKAVKEWGKKLCTKSVIEKAKKCLEGEVETYDQWINGKVVGYSVEGPLCDDSCWGYYPDEKGNYDYPIDEAKSMIRYARNKEAKRLREERRQRAELKEAVYALL